MPPPSADAGDAAGQADFAARNIADRNIADRNIADRNILVAVCGGIAAFKSASVVSALAQRGATVTVAMTESATRFIGPPTFQALSGRPVLLNLWDSPDPADPQHIRLTRNADLFIVAPATANIIAKVANGLADDLVSTMLLAAPCPILLAPAMNDVMWRHPAVRHNIETLRAFGYHLVGPEEGWLACRSTGPGRMSDPESIVDAAASLVQSKSS